MFNLDPAKLLIIGVVAIFVLGPDKLPRFARQTGDLWRSFNEVRHRMETEVRAKLPDLPPVPEIAHLAKSPIALMDRLAQMSTGAEARDQTEMGAIWDGAGAHSEAQAPDAEAVVPPDRPVHGSHPQRAPVVAPGDATLN